MSYIYKIFLFFLVLTSTGFAMGRKHYEGTVKPNDEFYSTKENWLDAINIERAWEFTTGSKDIVVAVIDTGFAFQHEDLKNQVWNNPHEIPDNGIDDDDNGYIDDVHGWDFVANDNDPSDEWKHGTHMSGIIGAEGNNNFGMAGVNWKTSIMPLRVLNASGSGKWEDAVQAIYYAVDQGARVVNMSWGGRNFSSEKTKQDLHDAIEYAAKKNVLMVTISHNFSENIDINPLYPAAFDLPNVITVSGINRVGGKWINASWGQRQVDIFAPAEDIFSTIPYPEFLFGSFDGTSNSGAIVSGLAALLLSWKPHLSSTELKNALLNGVHVKKSLKQISTTGGIVDAEKLFDQFESAGDIWPSSMTIEVGKKFQFSFYSKNENGKVSDKQWFVSDPTKAQIDSQGKITAIAPGDVIVGVKLQDKADEVLQTQNIKILVPLKLENRNSLIPKNFLNNFNDWIEAGF